MLAASFLGSLAVSMGWEMQHDSPIMIYIAHLIDDLGRTPYVEIFDMNLPGTYAVHVALLRVFGKGDLGFRLADASLLLALLALTAAALRRVSLRAAAAGALVVGCAYLSYGPRRSLQREFVILLPLAASLWATLTERPLSLRTRAALLGLFAGAAATVKPHAALGLPVFVGFACRGGGPAGEPARDALRRGLRVLPTAAAAFALPPLLAIGWLWSRGALGAFIEMATTYWPLYGEIAQDLSIVSGPERLPYLLKGWLRFGAGHFADSPADVLREGFAGWFAAAGVGFWWAQRADPRSGAPRLARLLAALAAAYSLYPVVSGKFWGYHWQPFLYFVYLLAALCLLPPRDARRAAPAAALAVFAASCFFLLNLDSPFRPRPSAQSTNPLKRRHEAIAAYLRENLEPGDRVQPLDWTGGAIHGMLEADAVLATSFVYDFHFYHHVETPTVRALRRRFLAELAASKPRFVIDVRGLKPSVKTAAARSTFPALARFLESHYAPVHEGAGFSVYERVGARFER